MLRRVLAAVLAATVVSSMAHGQRKPRPVLLGSEIRSLEFEHAFGAGAPKADEISLRSLRGRVVVLEYWATW